MQKISLPTPAEFSFELCLSFLRRSPREVLHRIEEESVVKALSVADEIVVFQIHHQKNALEIEFLTKSISANIKQKVSDYVREWFDLETDLKPFYKMG